MADDTFIAVPASLRPRQRRAAAATVLTLAGGFALLLAAYALTHPLYRAGIGRVALHDRINVNAADAPTLRLLPGVGPGIARRIIAHRRRSGPFHTPADLDAVHMIGPKTRAKLTPWIRFHPPPRGRVPRLTK